MTHRIELPPDFLISGKAHRVHDGICFWSENDEELSGGVRANLDLAAYSESARLLVVSEIGHVVFDRRFAGAWFEHRDGVLVVPSWVLDLHGLSLAVYMLLYASARSDHRRINKDRPRLCQKSFRSIALDATELPVRFIEWHVERNLGSELVPRYVEWFEGNLAAGKREAVLSRWIRKFRLANRFTASD